MTIRTFPLRNRVGRVVGALGLLGDTTERRRAAMRLRQVQKLETLGQLTSGIAHDFNNLLTVIIGNLDLIRPRLGSDHRVSKTLGDVAAAAERGQHLVNQLLAFARHQRLEPVPLDVNAVVARLAPLMQRTLGPEIEVTLDLEADLWIAVVDVNQMESALLNLALNARDAMARGRLTISTTNCRVPSGEDHDAAPRVAEYVTVSVRDEGSGIAPELMDKVLEPFFTTKPRGKGSGLGLSQVRDFVTRSGGHVRIESRVGGGTTVMLLFPRVADAVLPDRDPGIDARRSAARPGRGETVLVIDDEPDIRRMAVSTLRAAGFEVLVAESTREALAILAEHREIQLVFAETGMSGEWSGLDLVRHLRRVRTRLALLLTAATGECPEPVANLPFIRKPYRTAELVLAVEAALGDGDRSRLASKAS
jgi:nitrogen-specific signal transduction histidine kinase